MKKEKRCRYCGVDISHLHFNSKNCLADACVKKGKTERQLRYYYSRKRQNEKFKIIKYFVTR